MGRLEIALNLIINRVIHMITLVNTAYPVVGGIVDNF